VEVRFRQPLLGVVARPPNIACHAAGQPLAVVVDVYQRPLALVAGPNFVRHCDGTTYEGVRPRPAPFLRRAPCPMAKPKPKILKSGMGRIIHHVSAEASFKATASEQSPAGIRGRGVVVITGERRVRRTRWTGSEYADAAHRR
jgi:hypothetical protein